MKNETAIATFGNYYDSRKTEADRKAAIAKMKQGSGERAPDFRPRETVVDRVDRLFASIEPVLEDGIAPTLTISGEQNGNPVEVDLSLSVMEGDGFKILDATWEGQPPTSTSSSKKLYHHESVQREEISRNMSDEKLDDLMSRIEELAWSVHEYREAIESAAAPEATTLENTVA